MGIGIDYYIEHIIHTDEGWVTWTLDYSRKSDLDDSVGYWRVTARPPSPAATRAALPDDESPAE